MRGTSSAHAKGKTLECIRKGLPIERTANDRPTLLHEVCLQTGHSASQAMKLHALPRQEPNLQGATHTHASGNFQ
jgi:hypothetical protein